MTARAVEAAMPEIVINGHLLTPHQVDAFEAACMTLRLCLKDTRMAPIVGPTLGLKYLHGLDELERLMSDVEG